MRGTVEVAGTEHLEHVRDGVLAEEHAAEHRLLRRHVLRWLPAELFAGLRVRRTRVFGTAPIVYYSHSTDLPHHCCATPENASRCWCPELFVLAPTDNLRRLFAAAGVVIARHAGTTLGISYPPFKPACVHSWGQIVETAGYVC